MSTNGTSTSGITLPIVITHAAVAKILGSVISCEIPLEIPNASTAASAAGTSYCIAPITERRIHGRTIPRALARVITVATIASAGATVKTALDEMVF